MMKEARHKRSNFGTERQVGEDFGAPMALKIQEGFLLLRSLTLVLALVF